MSSLLRRFISFLVVVVPFIVFSADEVLPKLICELPSQDVVTLRWDTVSGKEYQLERSLTLSDWQPLGERRVGTGTPLDFVDDISDRAFYRLKVLPSLRPIRKVAVTGDSITTNGNYNLAYLSALGYYDWARVFSGSSWDLVKNGNTYNFGVTGVRSDQLRVACWDAIIASDADVCVLTYGVHDANQNIPVGTFIAGAISDWAAFREAGIEPVAVTLLPMGPSYSVVHPRIAEYNSALRIAAPAHNVPLCDWTRFMEAEPGSHNGKGDPIHYFRDDGVHPTQYAASMLGRELAKTLKQHFRGVVDVWADARWLTNNVEMAGSNGQPSGGWLLSVPAGGSLVSKTLVPSSEGNWWELGFSPGTSSSNFMIVNNLGNVGGSPAGKTVECTAEIEVVAGSLDNVLLYGSGTSLFAIDMHSSARFGKQVVPGDGIVVLRTLPITLPANFTWATASLFFNSSESSVFRVRRVGVRDVE